MENIVNSDNEYKSVNYGRMTAALRETVQEQNIERIDKLENEIADQKRKGKDKAPKANLKPKHQKVKDTK